MNPRIFFSVIGLFVLSIAGGIYFFPRVDHPTGIQPEVVAVARPNTVGIDGGHVYAENCSKCHGDKGEGSYGPPFTILSTTSEESLATLIRKGVPDTEMAAHDESEISDAQLAALINYLKENVLLKTEAQIKQAEAGSNPSKTQMQLALVQIQDSDLIARATLKDDNGAPMSKKPVVFNQVSMLGGRLPITTTLTNDQGLAIYYYPIKAGETVRIEAAYEGERGRSASAAMDEASLPGGKEPESLTQGLLSASPPVGLVVIIGIVVGSIWLTFGYVVSMLLQIASWRDNTSRLVKR